MTDGDDLIRFKISKKTKSVANACSIEHVVAAVSHWSDSNMDILSAKYSTCCCVKHIGIEHNGQHTNTHGHTHLRW